MSSRVKAAVLISALCVAQIAVAQGFDAQRAERNYRAVLEGRTQWQQLGPVERREVVELDALKRRFPAGPAETRQTCLEREGSANPSRLEREILDLKCSQRPD